MAQECGKIMAHSKGSTAKSKGRYNPNINKNIINGREQVIVKINSSKLMRAHWLC